MAAPTKHFYFIDTVRILAFLSIVMIHTSTVTFEQYGSIARFPWMVSLILSYGLRFSTPLFVMVSGYLFLTSSRSLSPRDFYRKRASKILLPLLFWNVFYYFFYCYFNSDVPSLSDFWCKFVGGGTYFHLYFLFLIAGLYVITPFLKTKVLHLNLNLIVPLLLLLSSLYYCGTVWLNFPPLSNSFTLFLLYIGYYLAGYWVGNWTFNRPRLSLLITFFSLSLAIIASVYFVSRYGIVDQGTFLANRLSLFIAVPALLIFNFLIKLGNDFFISSRLIAVEKIAHVSMGVYLTHPAIVKIFSIIPPFNSLLATAPLVWIFLAFSCTVVTAVLITLVIKKIPLLAVTVN